MAAQSVVTIPLKCEIWQADKLDKLFEIYRNIYNAMLSHELKQYNAMLRDPVYKQSRETINAVYRIADEKTKKEAKQAEEYKSAIEINQKKLREYGFSEFAFVTEANRQREHFNGNTSSMISGRSIGKPMWAAFEKLLFGNGEKVAFKRQGEWRSLVSDCRSGIRIVGDDKKTTLHTRGENKKLYAAIKTAQGTMYIPFLSKAIDDYKKMMLQREFRTARIVRKEIRGKSTFLIQLSVLGAPEEKYKKGTGEPKHTFGEGTVGIYIDTRSVVCCTPEGNILHYDLSEGIPDNEKEKAELQTYLDTSRRISNPDNFNPDGTVKHGIMENGKRVRLKWSYSVGYKKAKAKLKDLYRVEAEQRSLQRHALCYNMLSLGSSFICNDYPFEAAAMRKKETEYSEKTGRPLSKKKAGKAIGHNAPATLLVMMDNVLAAHDMPKIERIKLSDIDYTVEDYKEKWASKLQAEEV